MEARFAELERQNLELIKKNEELEKQPKRKTGLFVTEKGCIGFYGLRAFPVCFYETEWYKLPSPAEIKTYADANRAKLDELAKKHAAAK